MNFETKQSIARTVAVVSMASSLMIASCVPAVNAADSRPNIILFLADDEALDSFNMLDTLLHPATAKPRPKGVYAAQSLRPTHLMIRDGEFKITSETSKPPKFTALHHLGMDLSEWCGRLSSEHRLRTRERSIGITR